MSEVTKPILLDETGQSIVTKLDAIKDAITNKLPAGDPVKIIVVTPPTTTSYNIGDTLDLTGISVCAVFSNNALIDITDQCEFSPANGATLTKSNTKVDISWVWHPTSQTFTTSTPISVTVKIVTWASGTDAEIADMLEAHYAGDIDIHDYWSVGDKRTVSLSAMEATGVGESHAAQNVVYVLTNEGGKYLSDGVTECAFQVDQDDVLAEDGYIHGNSANTDGWSTCARRTWCNSVYRNALPSTLKGIFKQFINQSGNGALTGVNNTEDYFALRAEVEIMGSTTYSLSGEGSQVEYYQTSGNRHKVSKNAYWERSIYKENGDVFCYISWADSTSTPDAGGITETLGLCMFGCI